MSNAEQFRKAAEKYDLAELKRLLPVLDDINEQGPEFPELKRTALHAAAVKSQGKSGKTLEAYQYIMKFLYVHRASNDIKDSTGRKPSDYCPWFANFIESQAKINSTLDNAIQFSKERFPLLRDPASASENEKLARERNETYLLDHNMKKNSYPKSLLIRQFKG